HPFVYLRGATRVATGAEIHAHTVAVDVEIGSRAVVGPFCYLRPGTVLDADSKAGTFVEMKNSRIGPGAKVPHLSYIGDAEIGGGTNVGAGAITANFPHKPGLPKARTRIGENVRTGVQNAFVAPVEVGDGAWTAAGSVITKDVPSDALAVAPARQENREGYVAGHRADGARPSRARLRGSRDGAAAGPLDRARAAEAADGLLRPLASRARAGHRRAPRRRARRGNARDVRERRDVLPLRRVDPRFRSLHRADRLRSDRPQPDGALPDAPVGA